MTSQGGLVRSLARAAALFCATLLLCISRPQGHPAAAAGGSDEDVWQGTVTIVEENHSESDKTEVFQQPEAKEGGCGSSDRHASRTHNEKTTTYSDFRLMAVGEAGGTGQWAGTARVNVSFNGGYYTLDVHKDAPCYTSPGSSSEKGYETTTSGSGVGQGQVSFFRSTDLGSGKTTCHIDADAEKEIAKIPEVGRQWDSKGEQSVKQEFSLLAGGLAGDTSSFDCAPYAKSYSGQKRTQNPDGTSTETITWNIHGSLPETEVEIIPPKVYDQWLPEAKDDEKTIGNFIMVEIVAHKKGDPSAKPPLKVLKYKIELQDTSREKGVDLNWPPKAQATDDFDMKIDKNIPPVKVADDKGQSGETQDSGLTDFFVKVNSYDWGAYAKLHVTAELEDGSSVAGHVQGNPGKEALTLPKDDNDNHITDYWEETHWGGTAKASGDDDETPYGDGDNGDGLSLYEEYRGFHVQGGHIRTEPKLKDIFICDPGNYGLGYFAASGLTTHLVKENEFADEGGATNPHVINPNRGFATLGAQHLLRLKNENMPGLYGLADGTGPGPPKTTHTVKIDVAGCLRNSYQELDCTIAHELSHACHVWHHGDTDYQIFKWRELQPDGTWGPWIHYTDWHHRDVAAQGGQESGVEKCIMRYDGSSLYETATGPVQWQRYYYSPPQRGAKYPPMEAPGTIFCNDDKGTGVNASDRPGGSKAGDASKGKCQKQFCVNDTKH